MGNFCSRSSTAIDRGFRSHVPYTDEQHREDIIQIRTSLDTIQRNFNTLLEHLPSDHKKAIEAAKCNLTKKSV